MGHHAALIRQIRFASSPPPPPPRQRAARSALAASVVSPRPWRHGLDPEGEMARLTERPTASADLAPRRREKARALLLYHRPLCHGCSGPPPLCASGALLAADWMKTAQFSKGASPIAIWPDSTGRDNGTAANAGPRGVEGTNGIGTCLAVRIVR